jgi:hypothetical protein
MTHDLSWLALAVVAGFLVGEPRGPAPHAGAG